MSLSACSNNLNDVGEAVAVDKRSFGVLNTGENVDIYTLRNRHGMSVELMTLGATIVSIKVPDKSGQFDDVVLGFSQPQAYLDNGGYYGSVVGRYANRIAGGRLIINEKVYQLPINNGPNHLHGGPSGFDKRIWKAKTLSGEDSSSVEFTLLSPDGDQGYPGNLYVTVLYVLDDQNRLSVKYTGHSDKPTIVNLTQHSYFNLAGHNSGSMLDHVLEIDADYFTPIDENSIPTGEKRAVDQTPFDFRNAKPLARDITAANPQLIIGKGYDHNWLLNGERRPEIKPLKAAKLVSKASGRNLTIYTNKPGMQLYTGNFLKPAEKAKQGAIYQKRDGLCLETQYYPDSPNKADFPEVRIKADEVYQSQTIFEFGVEP